MPVDVLRIADLEIDRDRFEVRKRGEEEAIRLARKEFELLYFFASRPGRVFSRQDLLDKVWGHDVYVVDRTVDVHVRKIREKIGEHYIETVKGVGTDSPTTSVDRVTCREHEDRQAFRSNLLWAFPSPASPCLRRVPVLSPARPQPTLHSCPILGRPPT
jgi:DNA-binding winged helix-turn-helix (wHTH) protein